MKNANRSEIFRELFKTHVEKYNKSRDIQWKVNTLSWSSVVVATGFLYGKFDPPSLGISVVFVTILSVVFFFG